MKVPGLKLCLSLVALTSAAFAASTPTFSANPSAVDFQYSEPQPDPQPILVGLTTSNNTTPAITVTQAPASNTPSTLFQLAPEGLNISVGIDINTLSQLTGFPPAIYTSTLTVSATGFADLQIPLTMAVGAELDILPTPATLAFSATNGQSSQTVTLTGTSQANVAFTISASTTTGANWLSVTSNAGATPAQLTVTANPQGLTVGGYSGAITVTPATGNPLVIPVTLQVGNSTLTVTPNALTFAYALGGTTPLPQTVQLTDSISNNTYVAQTSSTGNWLLINGVTSNVSGPLPATLNVTVDTSGLTAGTYTGTITAADANNSTQTVNVTLVVNGISDVANPTALFFTAQVGQGPPTAQPILIQGFTNFSSYTAEPNVAWLSVSSTSGSAPAQILASVDTTKLAAGTYNGQVTVAVAQHTQIVAVTLVVSANAVFTSTPGAVIFNYDGGNTAPTPETLAIGVSSGAGQAFTIAPGTPSWLTITPPSNGLNTVSDLAISVAPQTLASGIYLAQIIVSPKTVLTGQSSVSTVSPVILNIANAPAVTASPTSLTFNGIAGGAQQTLTLDASAQAPLSFTTSASTATGSWLSVSPSSATTGLGKLPLTVTADPTNLTAGGYEGTVTLTTTNGVITQVPVTFNVAGTGVQVTITPSSLSFTYNQNGPVPAAQSLQISGASSLTVAAATTTGADWLSVSPTSGSGTTTVSVSVNPASLSPATYNGTITVTPEGSAVQTVQVTLVVNPPSELAASPTSLSFTYNSGNPAPQPQSFNITSSGAAVSFTAAATSTGWLSVTPTSATTPASLSVSVDPSLLTAGSYMGSIAINSGSDTLQLSIPVTLMVSKLSPSITTVANAASYASGTIAPGEIVVIFGSSIGPTAGVGAEIVNGYIPNSLGNVQVTFNGFPAPILYASSGQINAIVPYEISGFSNAGVEVVFGASRSNSVTVPVTVTAPGIFSADASGSGGGAILDLNYQLVSTSNPISPGDYIQIFATGQGQTDPAGIDGLIEPTSPPFPVPLAASTATVTIGNVPANIVYLGAAPGLVAGALQIDVQVPSGLTAGPLPLVLSIGGNSSQSGLTVAVQ